MRSFSYEDVSGIVKQSNLHIECDQNYNLLYKKHLQELWDNQINHQIFFRLQFHQMLYPIWILKIYKAT